MPEMNDDVLAGYAEFGHEALDGGQDRVVTAARAPADFLVGLEVLGGLHRGRRDTAGSGTRGRPGQTWSITPCSISASSSALNGSPAPG